MDNEYIKAVEWLAKVLMNRWNALESGKFKSAEEILDYALPLSTICGESIINPSLKYTWWGAQGGKIHFYIDSLNGEKDEVPRKLLLQKCEEIWNSYHQVGQQNLF